MKLLLDENLPRRLKADFPEHEIFTVSDLDWSGKTNGELLKLMLQYNFDAFITFDRNLQYQQNLNKYNVPVIVLNAKDNTYLTLSKLISKMKKVLESKPKKGVHEINEL